MLRKRDGVPLLASEKEPRGEGGITRCGRNKGHPIHAIQLDPSLDEISAPEISAPCERSRFLLVCRCTVLSKGRVTFGVPRAEVLVNM